jgi:acyl-CoA synthetase (AMP-forming)/AMP-acid ligase II
MGINEEITEFGSDTFKQKSLPTFVDVLSKYVTEKPNETALVFLTDGETAEPPITFLELHHLAMKFAAGVRQHADKGDRVVLLFQSSYEFAIAFFGCMYANVISIPLDMPSRRSNDWSKLMKITQDTETKLIITNEKSQARLMKNAQQNKCGTSLHLHLYEDLIMNKEQPPENVKGCDTVFLQYTSGSTNDPKGVVLSHENLIENQILLQKGFRNYGDSVQLSWLPLFHDMGLIGSFLQAIYIGKPYIFMSPNAFLQQPIRWLQAISHYKARVSGAPNFAYDLCVKRIKEEDKEGLDLSGWEVAFNGAEPVRADTLKKFSEAFKSCGFNDKAFYPCYGSAESTLIISGALEFGKQVYLEVEQKSYEQNEIQLYNDKSDDSSVRLVSSGKPLIKNSVVIVCPESKRKLFDFSVGEIWLNSPCNAKGYWNNIDASEKAFQNKIEGDKSDKVYLNTGDLGFFYEDDIFITGRTKDLLIFNGRNIYPQDIENCSTASDVSLKAGRCAATSVYIDGKERLVLIHELERTHSRKSNYDKVIDGIKMAVKNEFSIPIFSIVLVSPSTIPMTSSGKIRRQSCLEQFKCNELNIIMSWSDSLINHH